MYGIDIFDNIKMSVDWYMVYWGIKNKILNVDIAQDYVCRKMEQDDVVSEEELELAWKSDDLVEILENIEQIPLFQNNLDENLIEAKNKIRVAIIIFLRKTENDIAKLIEKTDMVYADFDYPQDMENFISYMPIADEYISAKHSWEDNRKYLLNKLDIFIDEQVEKYCLQIV